jgi:hypothetical protein
LSYEVNILDYDCLEAYHLHSKETGLLPFNLFAGYINSPESVDRGYLTKEEIQTLIEVPMKNHKKQGRNTKRRMSN